MGWGDEFPVPPMGDMSKEEALDKFPSAGPVSKLTGWDLGSPEGDKAAWAKVEDGKITDAGWGAFPIIPARQKTEFFSEVELIPKSNEIDLTEQPFEFDRELSAIRVGHLCVHRADDGVNWRVTHVPTLLSFMGAVPANGNWTKEQLLSWCKLVQQNWQDYWAVLAELNEYAKELTKQQEMARDVVKEHCLGTPVPR